MTIVIPDICNRVRVFSNYQTGRVNEAGELLPLVGFVLMHNTAPLERGQLLSDMDDINELKGLLLTDEWTKTQPFANNPLLSNVWEFVRNDERTQRSEHVCSNPA